MLLLETNLNQFLHPSRIDKIVLYVTVAREQESFILFRKHLHVTSFAQLLRTAKMNLIQ